MPNTNYLRFIFFSLFLITVACAESEREQQQQALYEAHLHQQFIETDESFTNGLSGILDVYFDLKDALVSSNTEDAAMYASKLIGETEETDVTGLSDETVLIWSSFADFIITNSDRFLEQSDIDEQRVYFEKISKTMIQVVDSFRPVEYEIFVHSCPMVRDESADWLSLEQHIKNPYHGDRMLNCGEVLRRI